MVSDFTDETDIRIQFSELELDDGVDFIEVGDNGFVVVPGSGWGEGGWGEGPWGGDATVVVASPTTVWTNIDEP